MRGLSAACLLLVLGGCASVGPAPTRVAAPRAAPPASELWCGAVMVGAAADLGADAPSVAGPGTVVQTPQLGVPLPAEYGSRPLAIAAHGIATAVTQPTAADLVSSIVPAMAPAGIESLAPHWPEAFSSRMPTQEERLNHVTMLAVDRTDEIYAAIFVEARRRDAKDYAAARRAARMRALEHASATDVAPVRVRDHAGYQFEVEGRGEGVTLLETVIEGREWLVTVAVWTPSERAARSSDLMRGLAAQVEGIR